MYISAYMRLSCAACLHQLSLTLFCIRGGQIQSLGLKPSRVFCPTRRKRTLWTARSQVNVESIWLEGKPGSAGTLRLDLGSPALHDCLKPHATKDTFLSYLQLTVSNLPALNVITHFPGWLLWKKVNGMFKEKVFVTYQIKKMPFKVLWVLQAAFGVFLTKKKNVWCLWDPGLW